MNFSAVILAGGKSSRMGRDKSQLRVGNETLLERQVKLARQVGAREVLISTPSAVESKRLSCVGVRDRFADCGPLGGIESALCRCQNSLLLVLAVDMPQLEASTVIELLADCTSQTGAVPRVGGRIEPLVAVYPKAAVTLATDLLSTTTPGRYPGATDFASLCIARNYARFTDLPSTLTNVFRSWNEPRDVTVFPAPTKANFAPRLRS